MSILNANELQRGDVVKSYPCTRDAWQEMIVERVEQDIDSLNITFFRPYMIPLYTVLGNNRCVPMIGVEHFTVPCHSGHQWVLVKRNDILAGS